MGDISTDMPTGIFDALQAAAESVQEDWEYVRHDANYREMTEYLYTAIQQAAKFACAWGEGEAAKAMQEAARALVQYMD